MRAGGGGGGGGSGEREGVGALAARRAQFANAANDISDDDIDASDFGVSDDEDDGAKRQRRGPLDLTEIAYEDEMAPLVLPADPEMVRAAKERRRERRRKRSATASVKPDPDSVDGSVPPPATGGLAPTAAEATAEAEADLDTTVGPELVHPNTDEGAHDDHIHIFQFPRTFPSLVDPVNMRDVKPKREDEDEGAAPQQQSTGLFADASGGGGSEWASTRRIAWPTTAGQIGQLRVRRSGRAELAINGDLTFTVLPAAPPGFLQELALVNPRKIGAAATVDSGESGDETRTNALLTLGQTNQKFLVVPDVEHLLQRLELQEQDEARLKQERADAAKAAKAARKARKAAAAASGATGKE